jgi:hypothetical protein
MDALSLQALPGDRPPLLPVPSEPGRLSMRVSSAPGLRSFDGCATRRGRTALGSSSSRSRCGRSPGRGGERHTGTSGGRTRQASELPLPLPLPLSFRVAGASQATHSVAVAVDQGPRGGRRRRRRGRGPPSPVVGRAGGPRCRPSARTEALPQALPADGSDAVQRRLQRVHRLLPAISKEPLHPKLYPWVLTPSVLCDALGRYSWQREATAVMERNGAARSVTPWSVVVHNGAAKVASYEWSSGGNSLRSSSSSSSSSSSGRW